MQVSTEKSGPGPNGSGDGKPTPAENEATVDTVTAVTGPSSAGEAPPESIRREPNIYASTIWLMQHSPRHRHLFLADLEWALLPPLALRQFRLTHKDGMPVAFATWAFVSADVEELLKLGQMRLKPTEWHSGEHCWLIDLVAPPGADKGLVQALKQEALADHNVKYLGRDPETGKMKIFGIDQSEEKD